ncbi:MAG TPA: hypothetical protein VFW94_10365 [Candidatus Acidoferrales bacterium]|nr:hypothetical protein [Candidatus Acidoferrales bacterium]
MAHVLHFNNPVAPYPKDIGAGVGLGDLPYFRKGFCECGAQQHGIYDAMAYDHNVIAKIRVQNSYQDTSCPTIKATESLSAARSKRIWFILPSDVLFGIFLRDLQRRHSGPTSVIDFAQIVLGNYRHLP